MILYSERRPTIWKHIGWPALPQYAFKEKPALISIRNIILKNKYYKIKNSWGTEGHVYEGYFYASEAYVMLQTIGIAVHKDVIPKKLAKLMDL